MGAIRISIGLFVVAMFVLHPAGKMFAQDCSDALSNRLCADSPQTPDSLRVNPFFFGCFNYTRTQYYSFTTGSNEGANVRIALVPDDCDDFIGDNEIGILVVQLNPGADPCDVSAYTPVTQCFSSETPQVYNISGLATNTTFLVLVGSDHSPIYGPCSFRISITGSAVDLIATTDPFLIVLGETVTLTATGASSGSSYTWTPTNQVDNSSSATTTSAPESSTTFTVSSTIDGCPVTAQVSVTVGPPITVYNTFSPNGDGINDGWKIRGIERFEDALVNVFDRWGQNVFRSLGYGTAWDGTNRGKFLPAGAYYYVIELNSENVNIPPISGVVSIIR